MSVEQIVGLGLAGLGGVFFLIGILSFLAAKKFKANAIETTGTVTGFEERRSSSASGTGRTTTYAPRVSFQTKSGQQIEFVSPVSTSKQSVAEGGSIQVLYLEGNPQQARVKGTVGLGGVIMLFVGIVLVAVGLGVWSM